MQQQPLATVKEAEPEKVVVNESQQRPNYDISNAEPAITLGHGDLGAHRRIAVHVVDVAAQGGIGIVNQRVGNRARWAIHLNRGMCAIFFESPRAASNEA